MGSNDAHSSIVEWNMLVQLQLDLPNVARMKIVWVFDSAGNGIDIVRIAINDLVPAISCFPYKSGSKPEWIYDEYNQELLNEYDDDVFWKLNSPPYNISWRNRGV